MKLFYDIEQFLRAIGCEPRRTQIFAYGIPIPDRAYPNTISQDIIGVMPITTPTGKIFRMRVVYSHE